MAFWVSSVPVAKTSRTDKRLASHFVGQLVQVVITDLICRAGRLSKLAFGCALDMTKALPLTCRSLHALPLVSRALHA